LRGKIHYFKHDSKADFWESKELAFEKFSKVRSGVVLHSKFQSKSAFRNIWRVLLALVGILQRQPNSISKVTLQNLIELAF